MSRFVADAAEQLRRDTELAFARLAFQRVYFVPVDVKRDATFVARVLMPIVRRYTADAEFDASEPLQLRHRSGPRSASCEQIRFTGACIKRNAAARWYAESELPDVEELNSTAHGVLAFVGQPYLLPATREENVAINRAVQAGDRGRWRALQERVARERRRMARGTCYATLFGLDYGTMQRIVIESFFEASRLGVSLPRAMQAVVDAAFLCCVPATPLGAELTRRGATRAMFDYFVDVDLLRFYTETLGDERQVNSIAAAVAAMNGVGTDTLELGEPTPNNKRRALVDDDDGDADDVRSVYSVATTSVSVTSQRSVPGVADYSFERNPYSSVLVPSELSDRLRGTELRARPAPPLPADHTLSAEQAARVPSFWLERAPPAAFVARVRTALTCAVRLLDRYCGRRIDRWRAVDYFYLHQLALLPSEPTAAELDAVHMLDGVLDAVADVDELRALVSACRDESSLDEAERVAPLVATLFDKNVQLHAVLDSFQTRSECLPRRRRTHAALRVAQRVSERELRDFAERHALTWAQRRLDAVARARPDAALSYVLRFDATVASPLALLTSVRAFAAQAADGVDFLVVWTPRDRALKQRHAAREPPHIYLALSHTLWRRLLLGATPRAVAERRAGGATVEHAPLVAPVLVHALRAADPDTVIDALGAVQTLCTSLQGAMPTQWLPGIDARRRGARHAVEALRAVASALCPSGNWARRQQSRISRLCGGLATRDAAVDGGRTTRMSSIFSALHAALAGDECYVFMTSRDAHALVAQTGPDLFDGNAPVAYCAATQLRATDDNRVRWRAEDEAAAIAAEDPLAARNALLFCDCQTSAQECDRMRRQLERSGARRKPRCCNCERRRLRRAAESRGRKRTAGRYESDSDVEACGFCRLQHPVTSTQTHKNHIVLYAPGEPTGAPAAQLVAALALERNADWMCTLRVGRRVDRAHNTPLPRDAAARSLQRRGSRGAAAPLRPSVEHIVAQTRRAVARAPPRALDSARVVDAELCALLVALELAALVPHAALIAADAKRDGRGAEPLLGPLNENELATLTDSEPPEPACGDELLFPLCDSAMAESQAPAGADDRYIGEAVDSKTLLARSEHLLYAGRLPRPLARAPSAFAELVLLHHYAPEQ